MERGGARLAPRPSRSDPLSTVWEGYHQEELLDVADWLLEGSPRGAPQVGAPCKPLQAFLALHRCSCSNAPAPRCSHAPQAPRLEHACLPRPPHPSAATTPMPEPQAQLAAACAAAPAPVVEPARQPSVWRASTDSSHLTHVSEGVSSWLAGWGKLAEEQGCAVSPLETSTMQALLQRVPSQPAPARRVHSPPQEHAPARRPAARASSSVTARPRI